MALDLSNMSQIHGFHMIQTLDLAWLRYMEPPYNDEDRKLIQELIKTMADPPESWPLYRVSLQGHASKA